MPQPRVMLVPAWLRLRLLLFLEPMSLKWRHFDWNKILCKSCCDNFWTTTTQKKKNHKAVPITAQNNNKEEAQQNKPSVEEWVAQLCCCCWTTSWRDSKHKCLCCGVTCWQARCVFLDQLSTSAACVVQRCAALLVYLTADAPPLQPVASPPLIFPHSAPVGAQTVGWSHKLGHLFRVLIRSSHVLPLLLQLLVMWHWDFQINLETLFIIRTVINYWPDVFF